MKCEQCGCEIGAWKYDSIKNDSGGLKYIHTQEDACWACIKLCVSKIEQTNTLLSKIIADKMTGEPTKPERFAHMRKTLQQTDTSCMYTYGYFIEEFKEILAAYDEARKEFLSLSNQGQFCSWLKKWG